ncbi:hypothetical protein BBK82_08990 [Lentzea guizhouensis]|uniref:Uncharacterized protein n=1 Tax=Lentzea guizhouensis TaxID=1586287 RepID=A0A1B2HEM6_9PSEU|nr:hypothetical protein BBK82_08990 [Lentzea guizhouensis]
MDVVVQVVRISWTRLSRGGDTAALRNAAPVGFPLHGNGFGVTEVRLHESGAFVPEWGPVRSDDRGEVRDLSLKEEDGRLRVLVRDNPFYAPRRDRRPPAVRIPRGEWVRWQINHRFGGCACGSEWVYELVTMNVAYGVVRDPGVFLGEPTKFVDERAWLR